MVFVPKVWQNAPSTVTPLSAAALIDLETRITSYTDQIATLSYTPLSVSGFPSRTYTTTATDSIVAITETGGVWTVTLAAAAGLQPGHRIRVQDESGGAATHNIIVTTQGGDLINGVTAIPIVTNYGYLDLSINALHNGYYSTTPGAVIPPQPPGPVTPPVIT